MSVAVASVPSMSEIQAILARLAVDSEADAQHGWQIQTYSDLTRVKAGTAEIFPEPAEAVAAALSLRQALLESGLEERHRCTVGASTDLPGTDGWRGIIDLGFGPTGDA
jgi:hypothetical protein